MKYTLTRANPDADQYPLQDRQIVTDPLEEEVNKSVMMTRLEDVLHTAVNWGVKTLYGLLTSVHHAVMLNMRRL
jgi:NADH-quinone oxidoreductase subunit B